MKKSKKIIIPILAAILIIGFVYEFPLITYAAITHDVDATPLVANGFAASPTDTFTSGATSAGATLGVLTCMVWQDVAGTGTVGSATYNGSTITQAVQIRGGGMDSYVGYIINPASGAKTVSVVISGNIDAVKCTFSSYFGTDTTSPLDNTNTAVIGVTPYTSMAGSITPTGSNELVVASLSHFGTQALTIGGGQTSLYNDVTGSTGGSAGWQVGTSGAVLPSWTVASNSNDWSISMASFKVAAAATVVVPTVKVNGPVIIQGPIKI